MDARITALTPWQRVVYDLLWNAATGGKVPELDRMKRERPKEYAAAYAVWEEIMFEVMY